jgi:hypothetical protein
MATMNPNSRSQRAATPDTTVARRMAYFSAMLFVLGGLILISTSFAERNASHHTYREYKALNTTVLEDIWEQRRAFSGLKVMGDFIFCIAYLSMVPAIMITIDAIQHSSKLSSGTRLLSPCFGIVAFTVVLTFLTSAGTCKCGSWGPWRAYCEYCEYYDSLIFFLLVCSSVFPALALKSVRGGLGLDVSSI